MVRANFRKPTNSDSHFGKSQIFRFDIYTRKARFFGYQGSAAQLSEGFKNIKLAVTFSSDANQIAFIRFDFNNNLITKKSLIILFCKNEFQKKDSDATKFLQVKRSN